MAGNSSFCVAACQSNMTVWRVDAIGKMSTLFVKLTPVGQSLHAIDAKADNTMPEINSKNGPDRQQTCKPKLEEPEPNK